MYLLLASCIFIEIKTFWLNSEVSRAASWRSELPAGSCCCGRRAPVAFQLVQMSASGLLVKCSFFYLESLCIRATSITFGFFSAVVFNIITCQKYHREVRGSSGHLQSQQIKFDQFFCKVKIIMWTTHLQRQAPVSVILAWEYLMD